MSQRLYFVDFFDKDPAYFVRKAKPFQVDFSESDVKRVWTLYQYTDLENPPSLPYQPIHHRNAFAEDRIHDWTIDSKGLFRYASRVTDDPVWILIELK